MRGLVLIWLVVAISFALGWMSHSVVIRRKVMSFPAERPQTEISLVIDQPPEAAGGERESGRDPMPSRVDTRW